MGPLVEAQPPIARQSPEYVTDFPSRDGESADPTHLKEQTMTTVTNSPGAALSDRLWQKYLEHQTLVKYFLIGGMASAIDVLLFLYLYNVVGTTALTAHTVSVPTSVIFSFVTNARHNFRTNDFLLLRLISFVIVCGIGYLAGLGVITTCGAIGLGENVGKIASLPVVFVIQFVLNSRITFCKIAP